MLMHTRALMTYLIGGYLPWEKIIGYGIFQNKGKCLYFNTPINNYKILGNNIKISYFTYISKENWKEDCNLNNTLKFSLPSHK